MMVPQEPQSYLWGDSIFDDWIKSSPDASTYLHSSSAPSSCRISISDLLSSSPLPVGSVLKSKNNNGMATESVVESNGSLVRSPRSADLVGLCRRTSMTEGDGGREKYASMLFVDDGGKMKHDFKGKGKARKVSLLEDYTTLQVNPEERWEEFWKEYETQAGDVEASELHFENRDVDMSFTDEYRRAENMYTMSPFQNYLGPKSSPTWGRRRQGTSTSDYNYDHMAIEELMKGMEVYSDTDYEQTPDYSDFSRVLFDRSCSPGTGNSKSYSLAAAGKRKASPSLEEPDFKKPHMANSLRGERFRYSVNPLLKGKRRTSPCAEEPDCKRRHLSNPPRDERVISMAYPIHDIQYTLYGCDCEGA